MNRWELSEDVKEKHTLVVQEFINQVELNKPQNDSDLLEINLSDTELNPFTLQKLLESLGYQETDHHNEGWQLEYRITMQKDGFKSLDINGSGITFELKLSEKEEW